MKAVDKGLELISYAAGGIGLAQNSTPYRSKNQKSDKVLDNLQAAWAQHS